MTDDYVVIGLRSSVISRFVADWLVRGLDILNVTNNNVALAFNGVFAPREAGWNSPIVFSG